MTSHPPSPLLDAAQELAARHPKATLTLGSVAGLAFLGWFLHRNDPPVQRRTTAPSPPISSLLHDSWLGARAVVAPDSLSTRERAEHALHALRASVSSNPNLPSTNWAVPTLLGASLGAGVALGLDKAVRQRTGASLLEQVESILPKP